MANQKKLDFNKHPVCRAYTLLVYHRFKKIDEEIFGEKEYRKRRVEDIQESENFRRKLHDEAVGVMKKLGYDDKEALGILENECERLVKEGSRALGEDEIYCGACQIPLKREDWTTHQEENAELHSYLIAELMRLNMEAGMARVAIAKEERKKTEKKDKKEENAAEGLTALLGDLK